MRKWTRVAAYGLIVKDEKMLLCRLSSIEKHVGKWTLPGGGLEFGEHPVDGAIREIREETGLDARIGSLAGIDSITSEFDSGMMHSIRILYYAEVMDGELCMEVGGSTDVCEWFTQEEALALPLVDLAQLGVKMAFDQAARLRSTSK